MSLLRRVRGVLGTMTTWAAAWSVFGALFRMVLPLEGGLGLPTVEMVLWSGLSWAVPGAISGLFFALLVASDGEDRFTELRRSRFIALGALGAGLLATFGIAARLVSGGTLAWFDVVMLAEWTLLGGVCAAGSLAIARRPSASADMLDAGSAALLTTAQPSPARDLTERR
jgi:hypothetical protein